MILKKNSDGFIIRQMAIQQNVPLLTALDTADALLTALENRSLQQMHCNKMK